MTRETITIELFSHGRWHQAMELLVTDTAAGVAGRTRASYLDPYIVDNINVLGTSGAHTVSERFPLQFEVWSSSRWPSFALDIMPSGAARRWLQRRLNGHELSQAQLDFILFRDHTVSPIGHLRVARPLLEEEQLPIPFSKEDVCQRSGEFLAYAAELGAAVGGATGAGGDAPKLLMVEDAKGNVYPEGALPDNDVAKSWLVKWPRGRDTDRDRLVLRTEFLYAHAVVKLGVDTRPGILLETQGRPSLWLPRFDRVVTPDGLERLAVESFYSLAGVTQTGALVGHRTFLEALAVSLEARGQMSDLSGMIKTCVCRDILDLVLGNADNHGRNRAVIRSQNLRLAPVYDLAPMVMDYEGITRSTTWGEHEVGGRVNWSGVFKSLSSWVDPLELEHEVREFSKRLLALPDLLIEAGLDEEVMSFPGVYLRDLAKTFERWGLL